MSVKEKVKFVKASVTNSHHEKKLIMKGHPRFNLNCGCTAQYFAQLVVHRKHLKNWSFFSSSSFEARLNLSSGTSLLLKKAGTPSKNHSTFCRFLLLYSSFYM